MMPRIKTAPLCFRDPLLENLLKYPSLLLAVYPGLHRKQIDWIVRKLFTLRFRPGVRPVIPRPLKRDEMIDVYVRRLEEDLPGIGVEPSPTTHCASLPALINRARGLGHQQLVASVHAIVVCVVPTAAEFCTAVVRRGFDTRRLRSHRGTSAYLRQSPVGLHQIRKMPRATEESRPTPRCDTSRPALAWA